MRKRRERVKAWQDARASADRNEAKSNGESTGEESGGATSSPTAEVEAQDDGKTVGWSLEDDDEDQAVAVELDASETGMQYAFIISRI